MKSCQADRRPERRLVPRLRERRVRERRRAELALGLDHRAEGVDGGVRCDDVVAKGAELARADEAVGEEVHLVPDQPHADRRVSVVPHRRAHRALRRRTVERRRLLLLLLKNAIEAAAKVGVAHDVADVELVDADQQRKAGEHRDVQLVRQVEERRVVVVRVELVHADRVDAHALHERQIAPPDGGVLGDKKVCDALLLVGRAHVLSDGRRRVCHAAQQRGVAVEEEGTVRGGHAGGRGLDEAGPRKGASSGCASSSDSAVAGCGRTQRVQRHQHQRRHGA